MQPRLGSAPIIVSSRIIFPAPSGQPSGTGDSADFHSPESGDSNVNTCLPAKLRLADPTVVLAEQRERKER